MLSVPEQARRQEEICIYLCDRMSYEEETSKLHEHARSIGSVMDCSDVDCSVLRTWPPVVGGAGFSAFAANVWTGDDHALIFAFRGTHGAAEWMRYKDVLRGPSDMEGLDICPIWVETLEQIWSEPGDGCRVSRDSMRDMIVKALTKGTQVWLTGHSKGGAIATTAAALLMCGRKSRHPGNLSELSVVTFNAAKVLRRDGAQWYRAAQRKNNVEHRRLEHRSDWVSLTPPRYEHVGDQELRGRGLLESPVVQVLCGVTMGAAALLGAVILGDVWKAHAAGSMPAARSADDEEEDRTSVGTSSLYNDKDGNGAPRGRPTFRGNATPPYLRSLSPVSVGDYSPRRDRPTCRGNVTPPYLRSLSPVSVGDYSSRPHARSCRSPVARSRRTKNPTLPVPVFRSGRIEHSASPSSTAIPSWCREDPTSPVIRPRHRDYPRRRDDPRHTSPLPMSSVSPEFRSGPCRQSMPDGS